MRTKGLLAVLTVVAVLAAGCTNKAAAPANGQGEAPADTAVNTVNAAEVPAPSDANQAGEAVLSRVREIYAAAERAYMNTGEEGSDVELDPQFCSMAWQQAVADTHEKQMEIEDICLDADYWVMGQDVDRFSADNFKLEKLLLDENPRQAAVTLDVHNMGAVTPVRVNLVYEEGQWRIDNFTDLKNNIDWRQMMRDFLN